MSGSEVAVMNLDCSWDNAFNVEQLLLELIQAECKLFWKRPVWSDASKNSGQDLLTREVPVSPVLLFRNICLDLSFEVGFKILCE